MSLHKYVKLVTSSGCPCKKILHWANVCFSAHAISPPCGPRHKQPVKRFIRSGGSAHLRSSAPEREHWSPESLHD